MITCSFLNMPPHNIAIAIAPWFSTLLHTRLIRHALKTTSGSGLSSDTYLRLEALFFSIEKYDHAQRARTDGLLVMVCL